MSRKLAAAMVLTAVAMPAVAHHSYAMFDHTRVVELKDATVKEWQWTNPHTWLYLYVPNGTPNPDAYSIEGNNPGVLRRQGMGIGTFHPGMYPLLSGAKGGALLSAVLPDGKTVGQTSQAAVQ